MDSSCGVAILLDGEFVKKAMQRILGRFPSARDITGMCADVMKYPVLQPLNLHRIYYYTADPLTAGTMVNPLDKTTMNFNGSQVAIQNAKLLDSLELEPDVALRRGVLAVRGWKIGKSATRALNKGVKNTLTAADLAPNIQQKGVDMRIGLDIAALALKRIVYGVVLISGDADMLPAMKFARREGLRVFLHTLGEGASKDLKAHADIVLTAP